MISVSSSDIKKELQHLSKEDLVKIALRLARFKKENKQLLHYLLFAAHEPLEYAEEIKAVMDDEMDNVNTSSVFLAKKTIRKVLRTAANAARYSQQPEVEAELLLHFLYLLKQLPAKLLKANVLQNMYNSNLKKADAAITALHPDLQFEYRKRREGF